MGYSFFDKSVFLSSVTIGPSIDIGQINLDENSKKVTWCAGIMINAQFYFSPLFFVFPELGLGFEPFIKYNFIEQRRTDMKLIYGVRVGFDFNDNK